MRTKNVLLLFLLAGLLVFTACSDSDSTGPTKVEKIVDAIEEVRLELEATLGHVVPSINIYIQSSDDTYFASAAATEDDKLTSDTFFRFASNTKNFTSTAILNMYEDGWLDIYDNIIDTIPVFDIPYVPDTAAWEIPYKDEITIEQLLQHSAGVYDVDNDVVPNCGGVPFVEFMYTQDPAHQFTSEELVEQVTINNLSYFAPGTDYHYSNTGFTILSEIIARVYTARMGVDKTYADYLEDYIVGSSSAVPLNINFPYLADDTDLPFPLSTGIIYYEPGVDPIVYDESNMSAHVAEGNGYSNFEDMNQFIRTLMLGQNVLQPETIELMQTDVSAANAGYGLGCIHATNLGYGHNGCIRGYLSLMVYDPDYDVSLIALLPMVDQTTYDNFVTSFYGMYEASWKAREVLGYPGTPETRMNLDESMKY
ncbi:MAG: serine hydrolase domain-containing protein [Candidatus Cloacimonadales bacterium]|nr:serine hydrolase domain-containing protein [Candidatus Cloacimonadales bacterium]